MDAGSSSDVQPIDFDNDAQVEDVLLRLRANIQAHVDRVADGKDPAYRSELQTYMEEAVLAQLPEMIKQNITVKGRSWQEYLDQEGDATQPIDNALLRETIQLQEQAIDLSSQVSVARVSKASLLTIQADRRIENTLKSGETLDSLLEEQRQAREGRRKLVGADGLEGSTKEEVRRDLERAEEMLLRAESALNAQKEKAKRAKQVADEVERLRVQKKKQSEQ